MKKKVLAAVLAAAMVVSVAACGNSNSNSSGTNAGGSEAAGGGESGAVKLIFSNVTTDAAENAGNVFCDLVEEYSGGTITVDHFPDNTLGDDKTVIEQTQLGDIDLCVSSTSPLVNVYPDYYAFDAPYLFLNREHALKAMDSEEGTMIREDITGAGTGLLGLAWWENGFRNITNNKVAVRMPDDIKGMKLRTMENDVHLAAFKAFGANPTPMAFSEVYTAMQQGTIDGQENPLAIIVGNKFYEVQKYISRTEHIYVPFCVVMNEDKFNSLSAEQQEAIMKAMEEATEYQLQNNMDLQDAGIEECIEGGAEVIELTADEKAAWQQVMTDADIFTMVKDKMEHPEYLDAMLAMGN